MALASVVEGGIPHATSIALVGPPGSGKSCLCLQLALESVRAGRQALYLTTENTPSTILQLARGVGLLHSKDLPEGLKFIDAYSWRIGMRRDRYAAGAINNPGDLTEVNLVVTGLARTLTPGSLVIIDSVSGICLAVPDQSRIPHFVHVLSQRITSLEMIIILVLEEGAHDPRMIASLRSLVQGTIFTRTVEAPDGQIHRQLRIHSLIGAVHPPRTEWFEILLGDGSLQVCELQGRNRKGQSNG